MGFIHGYKDGDKITLLNTIYLRPRKDEDGKYGPDYLYIVYKDMVTGDKKMQELKRPKYTYYMANDNVPIAHNMMYIDKDKVHPVKCNYSDLKKSIAENTNNLEWFIDNLTSGNYKANDQLLTIPSVFRADMNIEDYYRMEFDRLYANEPYTPTKLYFDIEVDIKKGMKGDFPEMGECPVNAITIVDDTNKNIYTLLLEDNDNPLIEEFKKTPNLTHELKQFVQTSIGGWKKEIEFGLDKFNYKMVFFGSEIKLIKSCFDLINLIKPDFALAWNIAFDLPYLIERIKVLGYNPLNIICHPDFEQKWCDYYIDRRADKFEERGDNALITSYTVYLDQLITFASRRKGQRAISSFKLDYVGDKIAGVRKLDYSHITRNIADLPYLDYKTFVFYNVMDTIVQLCIERKVADVDFVFTKSLATNTRYSKVHRQTTYLINRGIKDFYTYGYIMGNNVNKNNSKEGFAGAFVADPTLVSDKPKMKINGVATNILENLVDEDYSSLYPSIIEQNNMSPATMYGKILFDQQVDPKENRFNNPTFDRSLWFIEDLLTHNTIDFCHRYLSMPDYEEMYNLIIEYFRTVTNPMGRFILTDPIKGKRIMYHLINNKMKRQLYHLVDNSNKRNMVIRQERMPKYDNYDK